MKGKTRLRVGIWLRTLVGDLDPQVRTELLDRLQAFRGLSAAKAAWMFGISRQAFSKWRRFGIPAERAGMLADLSAATDMLGRHVDWERIPTVGRRRAVVLGNRSLYEIAWGDGHAWLRLANNQVVLNSDPESVA